jgi:His/Glu/Gln/Arg/opine family amino acid ABC transporter permease subunit
MIEFDWEVFHTSIPLLISSLKLTVALLISSSFVGFFVALALAISVLSKNKILSTLAKAHVFYYRGTPLLVQIFLIYYGSGQFKEFFESIGMWSLFKEAWFCSFLAFTLNTSAYLAEIFKGAILNLPKGEIEAAHSFGMSQRLIYKRIILPRMIRDIIPFWGNEVILMLKATSLVSTITLLDLMGTARKIATDSFAPIEAFLAAAVFYLALTGILTLIFNLLEKRLQRYKLNT